MKIFLSHASEDKQLVEQVHLRIGQRFPEIHSWLDKYEIVGGDDLIEKVHEGISHADKFLIFLSPNSIDKPWVRTELRKALADEISGLKPEFIIPIKAGSIPSFPPFLESRFYIDIENKTEEEWLQEIYSAIHRTKKPLAQQSQNLNVSTYIASDNPNAALLVFETLFWAEPIAFKIITSAKVVSTSWNMPSLKGLHQISISEMTYANAYALMINNHNIRPKHPFVIGLNFEPDGDPRSHIQKIDKWDGIGGNSSMRFIQFN